MKFRHLFFLILAGLFTSEVWAERGDVPQALLLQAEERNLAQHSYWKKLLHYKSAALKNHVVSDIVAKDFFLSPSGDRDPVLELRATLQAFFEPVGDDPDRHAQCRFVARYQWLREMLDWRDAEPPEVSCPGFARWSAHGNVNSVSLIFATGYFSNPASYYGHILLRFNSEPVAGASGLLDQTLNFGAIVPEGENGLLYVTKGIFGGYEAAFSAVQFYRHNHNYAEDELRDMWVYELSLSKKEVAQLVAHGWELLHARFDYYFANENCAYRMSELLGLVVDEPMLFESLPWSAPGSVFDHLVELEKDGKPLVRSVSLIPSRLNRFHAQYRKLDVAQRSLLEGWVDGAVTFEGVPYADMSDDRKSAVVDALLDYVEFRRVRDHADKFAAASRRALLLERVKLPPKGVHGAQGDGEGEEAQQSPPHTGPRPNMLRMGVLSNDKLGHGASLTMRPAYFDRLSLDAGRIPYATLSMFELELARFEQHVRLRRLDIVNLEHMNIAETPLPEDGGAAWRIKFGVQDHDLSCAGCLVGKAGGGIGRARLIGTQAVGFVMLGGDLQTPHAGSGSVDINVALGVAGSPMASWKTSIEFGRYEFLNGGRTRHWTAKWQNRLGGERDWDIRLNFERNVASQWAFEYSAYW